MRKISLPGDAEKEIHTKAFSTGCVMGKDALSWNVKMFAKVESEAETTLSSIQTVS